MRDGPARRAGDTTSSSAGTRSSTSWPRTTGRRCPTASTPPKTAAGRDEPVVLVPQTTERWQAPHFVWAVSESCSRSCAARMPRARTRPGGLRSRPRRSRCPEFRREVDQGRCPHPVPGTRGRAAERLGLSTRTGSQPGRQALPTARSSRSTTRPASSSATWGADYYSTEPKRFQPHRRHQPGLSPAGIGIQAVQLCDRDR